MNETCRADSDCGGKLDLIKCLDSTCSCNPLYAFAGPVCDEQTPISMLAVAVYLIAALLVIFECKQAVNIIIKCRILQKIKLRKSKSKDAAAVLLVLVDVAAFGYSYRGVLLNVGNVQLHELALQVQIINETILHVSLCLLPLTLALAWLSVMVLQTRSWKLRRDFRRAQ